MPYRVCSKLSSGEERYPDSDCSLVRPSGVTRLIGLTVVASLLWGLLPSRATWAQAPAAKESAPALQVPPAPTTSQASAAHKAWRESMSRTPKPKKGCYKATYPNTQWQEVPCTTAPQRPYPPARGPRPDTVGNGDDFTASASGFVSTAVGSFDSVVGVTSESGTPGGILPPVANSFSLQLNTNFFSTSVCTGAANPSACRGWQQFVFSNDQAYGWPIFMQYWLINYGPRCPMGWMQFGGDCYKNSLATAATAQTIADLGHLSLTGNAASSGTDSIVFSADGVLYSVQGEDNVLNLAQAWKDAEFNIFGDGGGSEASFNNGSTIVVRTSVDDGTTNAPSCLENDGTTGETNSLTLLNPCCTIGGASPAIAFKESSTAGATSLCASGVGVVATFFNDEALAGSGIWQLTFPDHTFFGYYSLAYYPNLYHFGLGWEYVYDANDGAGGVYFYDFGLKVFLYTNPSDFPFLYDYSSSHWLWYYYGTSRYFYEFGGRGLFFSAPG